MLSSHNLLQISDNNQQDLENPSTLPNIVVWAIAALLQFWKDLLLPCLPKQCGRGIPMLVEQNEICMLVNA